MKAGGTSHRIIKHEGWERTDIIDPTFDQTPPIV